MLVKKYLWLAFFQKLVWLLTLTESSQSMNFCWLSCISSFEGRCSFWCVQCWPFKTLKSCVFIRRIKEDRRFNCLQKLCVSRGSTMFWLLVELRDTIKSFVCNAAVDSITHHEFILIKELGGRTSVTTVKSGSGCDPGDGSCVCRRRAAHASRPVPDGCHEEGPSSGTEGSRWSWGGLESWYPSVSQDCL